MAPLVLDGYPPWCGKPSAATSFALLPPEGCANSDAAYDLLIRVGRQLAEAVVDPSEAVPGATGARLPDAVPLRPGARADRVGAGIRVISGGLRILMDQPTEPISSHDPRRRRQGNWHAGSRV